MSHKDTLTRRPEMVSSAKESVAFTSTDEQVQCRAYELYQARRQSGAPGDALTDWIAAEAELRVAGNGEQQSEKHGAKSGWSEA